MQSPFCEAVVMIIARSRGHCVGLSKFILVGLLQERCRQRSNGIDARGMQKGWAADLTLKQASASVAVLICLALRLLSAACVVTAVTDLSSTFNRVCRLLL